MAGGTEYFLRRLPNVIKYKDSYLTAHAKDIQVLILGSSHPYAGIDPDLFDKDTFNASFVSQCLQLDWQIFNKYKEELVSLETIILPIAYFSLWYKLSDSIEAWRMKDYVINYGIKSDIFIHKSHLLSSPLDSIINLFDYYIKRKTDLSCTEKGMSKRNVLEKNKKYQDNSQRRADQHTYNITSAEKRRLYDENLSILERFAEYCLQNNIQLIIVIMPAYKSYREKLNHEQLNNMYNTIERVVLSYDFIDFIDLFDDQNFQIEDYMDSDHLNSAGTLKISEILNNSIVFFD